MSPSVFLVEVFDKSGSLAATGSAVAVTPNQVVTNRHVIEAGVSWRLKRDSQTWPLAIVHLDADHDLCELKAAGLVTRPLEVRSSGNLAVGERVFAIGAPESLELTMSEGIISGLRRYESVFLIQTSAPISPGSSGGGLFDAQGRLIGITTFMLTEGQNLNFALPGDWVQSLATREVALKENPRIPSPAFRALSWFQLGCQMLKAGENKKAASAFRKAARLTPGNAGAWNNLGIAYDNLRQYGEAAHAYLEAVRLAPNDIGLWNNLAIFFDHTGNYREEISASQEAIRLKPTNPDAWVHLGFAYNQLRQYDQAIQASQEAIRLKPDNGGIWRNLALSYVHLGKYDQAIQAAQQATRLNPNDARAWYGLGWIYAEQGNRSQVMRVYEKVKTLNPNLADKFFRSVVSSVSP